MAGVKYDIYCKSERSVLRRLYAYNMLQSRLYIDLCMETDIYIYFPICIIRGVFSFLQISFVQ